MQIKEQRHGAVTVIAPQGALVQADADEFHQVAERVMTRSMGRFVVDMSATPYVDSVGLEAMLSVTEQLSQGGQVMKLCNACETVREILEITDLASYFEHYADVNTAVRSFL